MEREEDILVPLFEKYSDFKKFLNTFSKYYDFDVDLVLEFINVMICLPKPLVKKLMELFLEVDLGLEKNMLKS